FVGSFGAAVTQAEVQHFNARWLDENGQCILAKNLFQVEAAYHIHIKDYMFALLPDILYFRTKRSVKLVFVHLFPFYKLIVRYFLFKLVCADEVVIFSIHFVRPFEARGGRYG